MKKLQYFYFILIFGFLLGIENGFIALWKDGCAEPEVFPYRASMLPADDQRMLEKGIRIENETDLARLLEDYLS